MLGREIVPELLQERCIAANIAGYIEHFIKKDNDLYERQQEGFAKVKKIIGAGEQTPSENAAQIIIDLVAENNKHGK